MGHSNINVATFGPYRVRLTELGLYGAGKKNAGLVELARGGRGEGGVLPFSLYY